MFLANENFPKPSINILRKENISVTSIQEQNPGISDVEVLKIAVDKSLIILTFDKDYGELIFRYNMNNPPSVIFFREKGQHPNFAAVVLLSLLRTPFMVFEGAFSVIDKENIRQRFYKNREY